MKRKIVVIIAVILCITLAISVSMNIKSHSKQQKNTELFIVLLYNSLRDSAQNLASCLHNLELGDIEGAFYWLDFTYDNLTRVHATLLSFEQTFDFNYSMISSFSDIARYMKFSSTVNGIEIHGIKADGDISEAEISYLNILLDDLTVLTNRLSDDSEMNLNRALRINEVTDALYDFSQKWDWDSDSPYFMLR